MYPEEGNRDSGRGDRDTERRQGPREEDKDPGGVSPKQVRAENQESEDRDPEGRSPQWEWNMLRAQNQPGHRSGGDEKMLVEDTGFWGSERAWGEARTVKDSPRRP